MAIEDFSKTYVVDSQIEDSKGHFINGKKTDYQKSAQKNSHVPLSKYAKERILILLCVLIALIVSLISVTILLCIERKRNTINNQKSAPCEDGWIWLRGKCYYFSPERGTWRNSEKFCHSHNSSLATIDNKEELDFLFRFKGKDNHWIGLRRTDDNKDWTWTNGRLYHENLFNITRTSEHSGEIEYVFLDKEGVRSQQGIYEIKWMCNRT